MSRPSPSSVYVFAVHIAREIGVTLEVQDVCSANEHWDGKGPSRLKGAEIPLISRIMYLAQTVDRLNSEYGEFGPAAAYGIAQKRSGTWFDPSLVKAYCALARRQAVWMDLEQSRLC